MLLAWVILCVACLVMGGVAGALLTARRHPQAATGPAGPRGPSASDVLEALPVAVLVVDLNDQVLLDNRAARDLGLVEDGVLVALPQLRRLVRDTRVHARPHDAELAPLGRAGKPPAVFRARLTRVIGGSVLILLEDVTDARRLEDVRRDFVANVSHELKTPTAALALLSEALQQAAGDPDAVHRFAVRAQRESARLAAMIQDLVALSRIEGAERQPDPVPVLVDRAVAESVDRVRTAATARGISVVHSGDRGVLVLGNEAQLTTALGNLLENAVNYSPDGARVVIGARSSRSPRGSEVEINVVDEGIGMSAADAERVFERFYRADPARARATGGTGLGLAIVKHVATNHGGTVEVRSIEGHGSTFTLRLPAARAQERA